MAGSASAAPAVCRCRRRDDADHAPLFPSLNACSIRRPEAASNRWIGSSVARHTCVPSQHDAARQARQQRHVADPAGDHRVGAEIFRMLEPGRDALLRQRRLSGRMPPSDVAARRRREQRAVGAAHHHAGAAPFERKQVHRRRADEAGGEAGCRARVDLGRRRVLLDMAVAQQHDLVGHAHGLGLVMRHVQHGDAKPALQRQDLAPHVGAKLRIEVRQRFIHQADRRLGDDGAAERHALLLAAGQLAWLALQQMPDAEDLHRARQPARALGCGTRRAFSPNTMFSATLRCGNSA